MKKLIESFDINGLMPQGYYLSWSPLLAWLNMVSDLFVSLSYYLIPLSLAYFVRQRKDFSYPWLITVLIVFTITCGTAHLLSVVTIWIPLYWMQAYSWGFMVLVTLVTVVSILWLVRLILRPPDSVKLQTTSQMLQECEASWSSLFNNMTNGFALHEVVRDAEGKVIDYRFLTVNPAFVNMTGIARDRWIGKCVKEVLPEMEDCWIENYGKVVSTGEPCFHENYADNIGRWFSTYAYRIAPEQFAVIVEDVTERKRMEEILRDNENKLNTILDNVEAYIYIKDEQYRYLYANKLVRQLFAQPLEAIIGKTDEDFFDKETSANLRINDRRVIDFGERVAIEETNTRKGRHFQNTYLSVKQPLRHDDGSIYGLCGISADITERRQMEEALKASETFTVSILNSLTAHIVVLDSRGVIIMVNQAWQQFADQNGLPAKEHYMLGCNYLDVCEKVIAVSNDEQVENIRLGIISVLDGKLPQYHTEYPCHSDTEKRWFYMSVSPLQDSRQGVVISHENITERKLAEQALKDSEEKFRSIINASPVPLALNDGQQNITFLNPAFINTFGYDLRDIPTLADWWPRAYPDTDYRHWVAETWQASIEQAEREQQPFVPVELNIRCKDNSKKTVLASAATISHSFHNVHLVVLYDITELKRAEAELRIAATVFEAQEGMLITDANEIILNVNQVFSSITGYSVAEVVGKTPRILASGRHDKEFYAAMWKSIKDTGAWRGEIWNRRKCGEIYPEWLTITAVKANNDNVVSHYVATLNDISERKNFEEHIHRLAFYDPLTQLPNRRLLQERLEHGIEMSRRRGGQIAVLMLDLDKFKSVNDSLGHVIGDELLQQVAECIKSRLRAVDTLARLGGDEFVVLIENVEHYKYVARVADDIIHIINQVFTIRGSYQIYIGTSIGISIYPEHGDNVEALLSNADAALYHAKAQGRGCFAYFSKDLNQKAHKRIELESRLRRAIEQKELRVYFQPQVDVVTGQLIGAEALVRWHDPVYGFIMPGDFIELAEETGLIISIGEWVLRETCTLGRQWLDQGLPPVTLAVNVSPYQFRRGDINVLVTKVLHDTGFPVSYLELEITESGLMENQEHAMTILDNLHRQGVRLAIDDFGTGYSSLAYLKYFPLDVLKIDKTFIDDIPFSQGDMTIASTIIAMAGHLGFKVLAEGVETPEQLAFLQQQGCDVYQGYLYSEPLSADEFIKLLVSSKKQ